jgi:hypothetical protein
VHFKKKKKCFQLVVALFPWCIHTTGSSFLSSLSFSNSSYWCAPGGCRGYYSDGRVFLCICLSCFWFDFFALLPFVLLL